MANTIRIKRSTGSSNPLSLENAELAFREGDEVLVYGKGTGGAGGSATSIVEVGGTGAFVSKTVTQNANIILAGPTTGSAAAPTFRSLVAADIPSIAHTKISDFDTGVQANRLDQMAAPTGSVTANSQKITNLATPTADGEAANKGYVDGVAQGLDIKDSVKVATTEAETLASDFVKEQPIRDQARIKKDVADEIISQRNPQMHMGEPSSFKERETKKIFGKSILTKR